MSVRYACPEGKAKSVPVVGVKKEERKLKE